jgi:hypothetical protein
MEHGVIYGNSGDASLTNADYSVYCDGSNCFVVFPTGAQVTIGSSRSTGDGTKTSRNLTDTVKVD